MNKFVSAFFNVDTPSKSWQHLLIIGVISYVPPDVEKMCQIGFFNEYKKVVQRDRSDRLLPIYLQTQRVIFATMGNQSVTHVHLNNSERFKCKQKQGSHMALCRAV